MYDYSISVAIDRNQTGQAVHLFTTEWMRRPEFDIAARHVVDNFLGSLGYRITIRRRDAVMKVGTFADFPELF